jgi:hypothetical protein
MQISKILKPLTLLFFVTTIGIFIRFKILENKADQNNYPKSNADGNSNNYFLNNSSIEPDGAASLTEQQLADSIDQLNVIMSTSKSVLVLQGDDTLSIIKQKLQMYLDKIREDKNK